MLALLKEGMPLIIIGLAGCVVLMFCQGVVVYFIARHYKLYRIPDKKKHRSSLRFW
jgi:hypothetical protein